MSRVVRSILWTLVGLGLFAPAKASAAAKWTVLETPRFIVVSQLREGETRAWAEDFDQFVHAIGRFIRVDTRMLPPLTVVLFAGSRDFRGFVPLQPDGRPSRVAGFFGARPSWSVIGLADRFDDNDTRRVILHEAVHWYMSAHLKRYPPWFTEGVAEVFSTFLVDRGEAKWGSFVEHHVLTLQHESALPLKRLLSVTREDALFNERTRTSIFYAQSWALVHLLLFGHHERSRSALTDYFDAIENGALPDAAFANAFGGGYAELERELSDYIHTGRYFVASHKVDATARITASVKSASPALVEVTLARLALGAQRNDVARAHARNAVQLAPDQPAGYEVWAVLESEENNFRLAREAAQRAIELGSVDASTLFTLAYARTREANSTGVLALDEAQQIAELYRRAIQSRFDFEEAYENLAGILPAVGQVVSDDLALLLRGCRLFPGNGAVGLGAALATDKLGDRAQARVLLRLARSRGLTMEQSRAADSLEANWLYAEASQTLEKLLEEERYPEALSVLDDLRVKITDPQARISLAQWRRQIVRSQKLFSAREAAKAGRNDEAIALFRELLADPGLFGGLRPAIRQELAQLERNATPAAPMSAPAP